MSTSLSCIGVPICSASDNVMTSVHAVRNCPGIEAPGPLIWTSLLVEREYRHPAGQPSSGETTQQQQLAQTPGKRSPEALHVAPDRLSRIVDHAHPELIRGEPVVAGGNGVGEGTATRGFECHECHGSHGVLVDRVDREWLGHTA